MLNCIINWSLSCICNSLVLYYKCFQCIPVCFRANFTTIKHIHQETSCDFLEPVTHHLKMSSAKCRPFCSDLNGSIVCRTWLRHQMETFPRYWLFVRGNQPVTHRGSPHKGQWCGTLMFSLICAWLSKQSRRWWFDRPGKYHYDFTVMYFSICLADLGGGMFANFLFAGPGFWRAHHHG